MARHTELEVIGRLNLWVAAIEQVTQLIDMANRAKAERSTSWARDREQEWNASFSEFRRRLGRQDSEPADLLEISKDRSLYERTHARPFPTWVELWGIQRQSVMLAAVLFCQTLNKGYRAHGRVADNTSKDLAKLRDRLMKIAIQRAGIDPSVIVALSKQIEDLRDETIAHADGEAFEFEHGEIVSKHRMIGYGVDDLDLGVWERYCRALRDAILDELQG